MHRLLLAVLLAAVLPACDSLKKEKVVITVHSQGTDMDSPKTIFRRNVNGRTMIFKIIPEFSTQSVAAIHPFPADDGSYGMTLKLDFKGTQSLDLVTRLRSGEVLMTMVNGTVVDFVRVDKPIPDGVFTIWKGFSEELVTQMEEKHPPIKDLKSSSTFLEMTPSTKKEKKESKRNSKRDAREALEEEKRKARNEFDPEAPVKLEEGVQDLFKTSR